MAASTYKKALVRRFDRSTLPGTVNPAGYVQAEGIELLSLEGDAQVIPYPDVRAVYFVRDFNEPLPERRVFQNRPKMSGLWVSLRFRDGEVMEGMIPNNLMAVESAGFTLIPPDPYGNAQRVFVPRSALLGIEVLGVVGSPLRKRKPKEAPRGQIGLFDQPAEP